MTLQNSNVYIPDSDIRPDARQTLDLDERVKQETCVLYIGDRCTRGSNCPYQHIKPKNMMTCRHWVRGLCKKGTKCPYLHVYDTELVQECQTYIDKKPCNKENCPFKHMRVEDSRQECRDYAHGFCDKGKDCPFKHVLRKPCLNYLAGFCPDGPTCTFQHFRYKKGTQKSMAPSATDIIGREADILRMTQPTTLF
ncbi:putative Cleavage and polyadenylation specificity factor subunit 4 [Blattamonas nauphoetae]|uniref:Cleavage and polyadenylation specificity factor subunit 4 n=1 Tax=Blattamonas nauphoetae TaxID=2049346 RepID=A0ABQ9YLL2_9EUKA|nr:putative Cleavage and polyadenylation specificity factor subunit 4 [Blattamonas nauphoetae]